jgi:hypothetical protein
MDYNQLTKEELINLIQEREQETKEAISAFRSLLVDELGYTPGQPFNLMGLMGKLPSLVNKINSAPNDKLDKIFNLVEKYESR